MPEPVFDTLCPMTTAASKQVVAYTRLSLDREGNELGVTRQLAEIQQLAASDGVSIARVFSDNSVSAFSGAARPAFNALRDAVRAGEVSVVYCWDTSRLYRRLSDLTDLIPEFEEHAVTVRTCRSGRIDLSTASGRMTAQIMASVSEHESAIKAERLQAKNRQRALVEKRSHAAIRPFGYQRLKDSTGLEPHPTEAAGVKQAFVMLTQGYSLARIAEALNDAGYRGTRGAEWSQAAVSNMLRNKRYGGHVILRGKVVGDSIEAALVDRELFDEVQRILNDPSRQPKRGRPAKSLLIGLGVAKCHYCGNNLVHGSSTKTHKPTYKCHNLCTGRIRDLTDMLVFDAVAKFLIEHKQEISDAAMPSDSVAAQIAELEALTLRREKLTAMWSAGDIDDATLSSGTKAIASRLEALSVPRAAPRVSVALGGPVAPGRGTVESDADLYSRLIDLPLESKRALVKELVDTITITKGRDLTQCLKVKFKQFG